MQIPKGQHKQAPLTLCWLLQHLPGRAAIGQQGTIGQALVRILGAVAVSSSCAVEASAGNCPREEDCESAAPLLGPGIAPGWAQMAEPQHVQTLTSTADFDPAPPEHAAGPQADNKTPRGADASSSAADGVRDAVGVHSPVSLADGMAGTQGESDAICAQSHAAGSAAAEPDTCVLFRPSAPQPEAAECSWIPMRHAPEAAEEQSFEGAALSQGQLGQADAGSLVGHAPAAIASGNASAHNSSPGFAVQFPALKQACIVLCAFPFV